MRMGRRKGGCRCWQVCTTILGEDKTEERTIAMDVRLKLLLAR